MVTPECVRKLPTTTQEVKLPKPTDKLDVIARRTAVLGEVPPMEVFGRK